MKSLKILKKNDLRDWAEELFQKNSYIVLKINKKRYLRIICRRLN